MASSSSGWDPNDALTLYEVCLQFCIANKEVFCTYDYESEYYSLRDGISLPSQVCENLLAAYKESEALVDDKFVHVFKDPVHTRLRRIDVSDTCVSEQGVQWLMTHKPVELDISGCEALCETNVLQTISEFGQNLVSLYLGDSLKYLHQDEYLSSCLAAMEGGVDDKEIPCILSCPNLRALSIHHLVDTEFDAHEFIRALLNPLSRLTQLDLSGCHLQVEFMDVSALTNLLSLNLSDVQLNSIFRAFQVIANLPKLRHLNLSQGSDSLVKYSDPEDAMRSLLPRLPHLRSLDLSGTNLCGFLPPQKVQHRPGHTEQMEQTTVCAIPGLEGRSLDFLGLLGCSDEACHRENLPARQVTGDANEHQVLLSIHTYVQQPDLLMKALNQLFHLFRFSECVNQKAALLGILAAMKKHLYDKHVQISGSASLFYIVKGPEKKNLNTRIKQRIVRAILSGMENHMEESTMMRNGFLTLCHFQIPHDLLFEYKSVVMLLLRMVGAPGQEEFIQRIGVYLLNSLACQVDGGEKLLVGDLGAIGTMIDLITSKLTAGVCDEVMEIAWSAMWNVTDETSLNCQRFIDKQGMELFLACLKKFPDREELLRNMMGLIGNVAEVEFLRPRLMKPSYVNVFCQLLESTSDGIEVSYNACGVLAHMVADGEDAWTAESPSRKHVLACMLHAIRRWKLRTRRNINYRSFEPILRLLPKYDTPQAQHWATWALCNLTKMYRSRYCPLLAKEHGLELLRAIVKHPQPYSDIKMLASAVLQRCHRYTSDPAYESEDDDGGPEEEDTDGEEGVGEMLEG